MIYHTVMPFSCITSEVRLSGAFAELAFCRRIARANSL